MISFNSSLKSSPCAFYSFYMCCPVLLTWQKFSGLRGLQLMIQITDYQGTARDDTGDRSLKKTT